MNKKSFGFMVGLLIAVGGFKEVHTGALVEIKFLQYSADCREDCSTNNCDPKFTFCLDRPRSSSKITPCYYSSVGESGYFQNENYIDFSSMTSIKGIPNPWIVHAPNLMDRSLLLVAKIRDEETFFDDVLAKWGITLTETIYPSQSEAVWANKRMVKDSFEISFKIRIYCEANYYGDLCSDYCQAADSSTGHYTCEPVTGNKICLPGWTGSYCDYDIDECSLNYCQNGLCQNGPGDYLCSCSPGYSGKNCEVSNSTCKSKPCSNNATCIPLQNSNKNFICNCVGDWEGELCNIKRNPCMSAPCQNGMECKPSSDHTTYFCDCYYPTTGFHCETIIPATTETATTQTTTSVTRTPVTTTSVTTTAELLSEAERANLASQNEETTQTGGFQFWYAIIIALAGLILLAIIILIVCLLMRRRKPKENPDKLAFENNVYNDQIVANVISGKMNQDGPMANERMPQVMPVFIITDKVNALGLMNGGTKYMRPTTSADKKACENMVKRLMANEEAETNPYKNVRAGAIQGKEQAVGEVLYYDLDEVATTAKCVDVTDQGNENSAFSSSDDEAVPADNPTYSQPSNVSSINTPAQPAVPAKPDQMVDDFLP